MAAISSPNSSLVERKQALAAIRTRARDRLLDGASGISIASTLGDRIAEFIAKIAEETAVAIAPDRIEVLRRRVSVIGVGGTGRRVVAPFSDVDMLILTDGDCSEFSPVLNAFVQAIWDCGLKLGQSVRSVSDAVAMAKDDEKTATSFVQTHHIWGSSELQAEFDRKFASQILKRRQHAFVEGAVRARMSEFAEDRPTLQELEPNVKTSHGGLRDLNLISWIAAAYHGTLDPTVLQLQRVITADDAIRLHDAWEFLLRIRIRMHFAANGPEDTLTRHLQLRLAEEEGFDDNETQRGVEQLMQEYFRHTSAVASIADRFVALHRRPPWYIRLGRAFLKRRSIYGLYVGPRTIDLPAGNTTATASLKSVLDIYELASAKDLRLGARLTEEIRAASLTFDDELSDASVAAFRLILSRPLTLPAILRHMHDTGVLDHVIPPYRKIRSLLQFNQYHDFTVDEHTLRAVETVCSFAHDEGPLGRAYQRIRNRDVLHLAVLLHDIGKGRQEDHSELGAKIALEVGERLGYDEARTERLSTLVLEHLQMADVAFRRDISDQRELVAFANRLGSPRTLIKLYLLTAADIMAVGPGTWTPWKAELLADLFERTMVIVSGRNYGGFEEEEIAKLKGQVIARPPKSYDATERSWPDLVEAEFDRFPMHYLMNMAPGRLADDLKIVAGLAEGDLHVSAFHDSTTGMTDYRVILATSIGGCFQNMCAVLTAKNCEIFSADIATTTDGFVIDRFRVRDRDYILDENFSDDEAPETDLQRRTGPQEIPESRLNEMKSLLEDVLRKERDPEELFARFERFDTYLEDEVLASGLETRVQIDNDTSTDRTIIDVFTQDRRGLVYVLAKSLGELQLSIDLAKIATHFDQVVDVFYVTERDGSKLSAERVSEVREKLQARMHWFDDEGYREFRRN